MGINTIDLIGTFSIYSFAFSSHFLTVYCQEGAFLQSVILFKAIVLISLALIPVRK